MKPTFKTRLHFGAEITYGCETNTGIYVFEIVAHDNDGIPVVLDAFATDTHRHPNHTRIIPSALARIMTSYSVPVGDIITMLRHHGQ